VEAEETIVEVVIETHHQEKLQLEMVLLALLMLLAPKKIELQARGVLTR